MNLASRVREDRQKAKASFFFQAHLYELPPESVAMIWVVSSQLKQNMKENHSQMGPAAAWDLLDHTYL